MPGNLLRDGWLVASGTLGLAGTIAISRVVAGRVRMFDVLHDPRRLRRRSSDVRFARAAAPSWWILTPFFSKICAIRAELLACNWPRGSRISPCETIEKAAQRTFSFPRGGCQRESQARLGPYRPRLSWASTVRGFTAFGLLK